MNKMCLAHIGVFLLALHLLTSQVIQAESNPEGDAGTDNSTTAKPVVNTTSGDKSGSGSIAAFTLLLPLSVAASLLHGCS